MLLFDSAQVNKHWRNNLILFICIIGLFVIGTAFDVFDRAPFLSNIFFSLLVLSSIFVIDYLPIIRKILSVNGILVVLFIWGDYFYPNKILALIGFSLLSLFLFSITVSLIVHVAASKDVNANIIFSAINGYLLIGIIGGISMITIDTFTNSAILSNVGTNFLGDYIYFSYVTLTTLGYGDITPQVAGSKVVAMLLAIAGQLYIAILIAMLVGKYLSKPNTK